MMQMELLLTVNLILLIIYMILLSKLKGGLGRLPDPVAKKQPDSVSILISLHNEEGNIPDLIQSLSRLDYPENKYEVIFVNDRSEDDTRRLLESAVSEHANWQLLNITSTPDGWGPKKYALHTGITKSRGQIILLTDADGRPGPDWITNMMSFFTPETGMVLGYAPYRSDGSYNTPVRHLLKLEYFSQAAIAASSTGLGYPATCVGTNLAYRRKVYDELDGFGKFRPAVSGDDDLFLSRVRDDSKWKIAYAYLPGTHIPNESPNSWRKFYHQRLRFASKGFKYPLKMTLSLMIYYFFNVSLLAMSLLVWREPRFWKVVLLFFSMKAWSEYRFLHSCSTRFGEKLRWRQIFPASLLHILYVVWFGAAAQFISWKWVKNE